LREEVARLQVHHAQTKQVNIYIVRCVGQKMREREVMENSLAERLQMEREAMQMEVSKLKV
jgi:hypothetical protein